jgi:hypothetical protein
VGLVCAACGSKAQKLSKTGRPDADNLSMNGGSSAEALWKTAALVWKWCGWIRRATETETDFAF